MKTILKLLVFLILVTAFLIALSSCSASQYNPPETARTNEMCLEVIPIRLIQSDMNQIAHERIRANISYELSSTRFKLSLPDTTICLKGLYRYSPHKEYYEAYDKDMHKYTLYHYNYGYRVYIQITPMHNAQDDEIDKSEVIYIVTTDDICS